MKAQEEKNVAGLSAILSKMTQRMGLANYAESTIRTYVRSVRLMSVKLGKSPESWSPICPSRQARQLPPPFFLYPYPKATPQARSASHNKAIKAGTRPAVPAFIA